MSNERIKVSGYAQKTFVSGNVEYRDFSPDLVGFDLTDKTNTPLFTIGNFSVTTNVEKKKTKTFTTTKFSNFVSLTDLDLTLQQSIDLAINNFGVVLNLDKTRLTNYALFSSFKEFVRVSLENIIINWPAALYTNPLYWFPGMPTTQSGKTYENYTYDIVTDESTFDVNTNILNNKYGINYLVNQTTTQTNQLRDLTNNYTSYSILYNNIEYDVLDFIGATSERNSTISFRVKGNVFSSTTYGYLNYYIKPNKEKENLFFNSLDNFEYYLLNRQIIPKYTSSFAYTYKQDGGGLLYLEDIITWPVSDGYNLDFDTDAYTQYATKLLEISDNLDLTTSNLMTRFLVAESISDFDTTAVHLDPLDQDSSDQKVNKTLNVYGVEFDKINLFITGIQFANTVTYNKNDNTPDIYLKNIARVLGWGLISSVLENDLLKSYIEPKPSTYAGQADGLTLVEADFELWRRIILNTPWIWKSKGTRKGIEFLFKFIGTPLGLITFNEYIYLAENKIDVEQFKDVLSLNNLFPNLNNYPIDSDGYPKPFPNTSSLYYQSDGLWYRETGGDNAMIDISSGNNPHIGKYDGGYRYINQFRNLIPNFSAVTINSATTTTDTTNLFTNYNNGSITGYSGQTYVDITDMNGVDFSDCYVLTATTINDPKNRVDETVCGCPSPEQLRSLSICVESKPKPLIAPDCKENFYSSELQTEGYYVYSYYQYNIDGTIYNDIDNSPNLRESIFTDPTCCSKSGNIPYYYNDTLKDGIANNANLLYNSGYICCTPKNRCGCFVCCEWTINDKQPTINISGNTYLVFTTELNETRVVSQDGQNCLSRYTTKIQITDPFTNQVGFGCQVTTLGLNDINQTNSVIKKTYEDRMLGNVDCCSEPVEPKPTQVNFVAVALNEGYQIGQTINSFSFEDITRPNTLAYVYFQPYNRLSPLPSLSGSTQEVGYYNSYYASNAMANNGDTIMMKVGLLPDVSTLRFNIGLHKMYYYISDTEYTNLNFDLVKPSLINLPLSLDANGNYIYGNFNLTIPNTTTNNVYVYMVYDYREKNIDIT